MAKDIPAQLQGPQVDFNADWPLWSPILSGPANTATVKFSCSVERFAEFRRQLKRRNDFRPGLQLFKIILNQNLPVGFESNVEQLIYGVHGHGPGGDKQAYFVYRLSPTVATNVQLEVVGRMILPESDEENLVINRFQEVRVKL